MPNITKRTATKGLEVKKHVGAIHVIGELSLIQRKISNMLLFHAYPNLLTQEKHQIDVRELANVIGFDSNDLALLKDALTAMTKISVEWNVLNPKGRKIWGAAPLLAGAKIENGVCEYAYSPFLREKLYQPEVYARIDLGIQKGFSSSYGLALYENAVRFKEIGTTGMRSLQTWRELLGVGEKQYAEFKNLKRRVIDVALTEVNGKSDILVEVHFEHKGRKIVGMRFDIAENPNLVMDLQINTEYLENSLYLRLLEFGVTSFQAMDMMERFDEKRIMENLDYVFGEVTKGAVKNVGAFTLSAIEVNYAKQTKPSAVQIQMQEAETAQQAQLALEMEQKRAIFAKAVEAEKKAEQDKEDKYETAYHSLLPLEQNLIDQRVQELFKVRFGRVLWAKFYGFLEKGLTVPEMPSSIRACAKQLRNEILRKEFQFDFEETKQDETKQEDIKEEEKVR